MAKIWFNLTHSLKVVKNHDKWVILIKKWNQREWSLIVPNRYLSKTNALNDMKEIKKRGFV